jgi:hypothetical protein
MAKLRCECGRYIRRDGHVQCFECEYFEGRTPSGKTRKRPVLEEPSGPWTHVKTAEHLTARGDLYCWLPGCDKKRMDLGGSIWCIDHDSGRLWDTKIPLSKVYVWRGTEQDDDE